MVNGPDQAVKVCRGTEQREPQERRPVEIEPAQPIPFQKPGVSILRERQALNGDLQIIVNFLPGLAARVPPETSAQRRVSPHLDLPGLFKRLDIDILAIFNDYLFDIRA